MAPPLGLKFNNNYNEVVDDVYEEDDEPLLEGATTCYTSSEENGNDDATDMAITDKVDEEEVYGNQDEVDKVVYNSKIKPKRTKNKSAKKKDQVNPYDVYMGRGGLMNRFRNGSLYRTLIVDNFEGYQRAFFKRDFAIEHIIKPIQKKGGRFFVPTQDLKGWTQGDIFEVIAPKVMQALRDCKKEDGSKAGHISNTSIRSGLPPSSKGKTVATTVKGGKKTSVQKKKLSKSPSSSSTAPTNPSKVVASSFNHPSNIIRKRLCLSSPAGAPSPKMPKLRNEFGGDVPVPVAATSPAPDAPVSSPLGTGGLFRHNLLLGSSPKDVSSSTMLPNSLTLPKMDDSNTKKVIMINESGHVMNTIHRTTGVCGFYHFLLSHHAPAFRRISEEGEGRFVWDNMVSPIKKQGGTIHLCCNSGKVQQEVNHKTIICISKALRDTEYIEEECVTPYGQSGATSMAGSDERSKTSAVKAADVGSSENSTAAGSKTPLCDKLAFNPALTSPHARVVTKDTTEIESSMQRIYQTPTKHHEQNLPKYNNESREFNMARMEVMSMFQKDVSNTRADVKCKKFNPLDVKAGSSAGTSPPVLLTKPAGGSYNALQVATAAVLCSPGIPTDSEKLNTVSTNKPGEDTESLPPVHSQPVAEVRQNETTETKDERLTSSASNETSELVTQSKEKVTIVATRKSSRVAAAAVAAEASPPDIIGLSTRNNNTTSAPHVTRSKRVGTAATVTPEQPLSTKLLCSQGQKLGNVASDDADCEKQQKVAWESRYNELIEYAKKHGNCNVPQRCDENPPLGRFVKINRQYWQRNRQGRKTPLTPEREALLDSIGFVWNMTHIEDVQRSYDWDQQLRALKAFKKRNGHCNAKTSELGKWVSYVRTLATVDAELAKKRGGIYLTEVQTDELNKLDFVWNDRYEIYQDEAAKDNTKVKGKDGNAGVNHKKESSQEDRGNFLLPSPHHSKSSKIIFQAPITPSSIVKSSLPAESLFTPVSIVRKISTNVKNVINEGPHSVKLASDPPHWFPDSNYGNNKDWSQCLEMLKCFQEKNGHTQVPYKRFPHNHTVTVLSNFVTQMREHKVLKMHGRPNLLTQEREDMLNSIPFEWETSFECTKEGAMLTKTMKSIPTSEVVTTKPRMVARSKKYKSKSNGDVKTPMVVDSQGTLWAVYQPLAVDRLLDASKTASSITERPPTPENWGVELAYESDGSNDSLTF